MFQKFFDALSGLSKSNLVFKFLFADVIYSYSRFKLFFKDAAFNFRLSFYLKCSSRTIKSYYKHVSYFHLEIPSSAGIFLNNYSISKDFNPYFIIIDSDDEQIKDFNTRMEKVFAEYLVLKLDLKTEKLDLDTKVNSVALQFILETFESLEKIEEFLINLKANLDEYNSIIFGTTVIPHGLKTSKKSLAYIKKKNEAKEWFNENRTLEEIKTIFNKHFEEVELHYEGSCLLFWLAPKLKEIHLKKMVPENEPLMIDI